MKEELVQPITFSYFLNFIKSQFLEKGNNEIKDYFLNKSYDQKRLLTQLILLFKAIKCEGDDFLIKNTIDLLIKSGLTVSETEEFVLRYKKLLIKFICQYTSDSEVISTLLIYLQDAFYLIENDIFRRKPQQNKSEEEIDACLSINKEGKITHWNKQAERLFGYQEQEVIGNSLILLIPERMQQELVENVIASKNKKIKKKDNKDEVKVLNGIFPIKDLSGNHIASGILHNDDVTLQKAEDKLKETRELINQIADSTPNVLYVFDTRYRKIVYVNKAITEVLGYTPEEVREMSAVQIKALIHSKNQINIENWVDMFSEQAKDQILESECRFLNKNGEWRWMNKRETVFRRDEDGLPVLILGIVQDITEQKKAQEKVRKSKSLLLEAQELACLGNWEWDLITNEISFSDELYKMLGFDPMQISISFNDVKNKVALDDWTIFDERAKSLLKTGIPVTFEQKVMKNGQDRYIYIKAKPVFNEKREVLRIHGIAQDITDRKKAEEEIQKANDDLKKAQEELIDNNNLLEARVRERTEELIKKNVALEKINTDLDNFVYTASHDLKAPISNIEGLIASLDLQIDAENDDIKFIIGLMKVSILRFKETIKDLTEISKIQKNFNEDETIVEFEDFLEDIKFTLLEMIVGSEAIIDADFSQCKRISFSRKNFKSILFNLISNAIKYQSAERKPEIFIKSWIEGNFAVISIKDNGLGFEEKDKGKIFGMFKRLHDHVDGSGVGLYIVKRIIENAGGKIEAFSEKGKGTEFKIFFPYKAN
ncbi:PAS domain-containing sensor histidine kinase [Sporocytophaga myxococcoides]|uniref:PAS domain-containing sensor histidine kinase n=1 Tax=Sporocytophaga myxococcoides TaxID=153721 RepID=UPI0003F9E2C2|nr:PAS domain-containing sensor histidine kinase [Sporocytophaga myxococcoides]